MSTRDWRVDIAESGRSGDVTYREPSGKLTFYWEFGGSNVLVSISVGTAEEWAAQHAWAAPRRVEIVRRVIEEVVRQRAPGCRGELGTNGWIDIYENGGGPPSATTDDEPP
ncbi:MAG: hypothetical protein ABIT38_22430 [Gemmatimonadaceae bacterium]